MARKVILLDRLALGSIDESYRVAFWLVVPEARRSYYANLSAVSVVRDVTMEELAAIRAGEIVEVVDNLTKPQAATHEQARAMLQGSYARRQQELNERNPWDRYGTYWDGAVWHDVTVA